MAENEIDIAGNPDHKNQASHNQTQDSNPAFPGGGKVRRNQVCAIETKVWFYLDYKIFDNRLIHIGVNKERIYCIKQEHGKEYA